MRQSHRSARFAHLCDVAVAIGLAAALACSVVACGSTDDTRNQLGERLRKAASASKDGIPRYARALRDNAACLSDEVTDRLGSRDVRALIDARGDLEATGDQLGAGLGQLREAVHSCVDVRATLIDLFESTGMTTEQATCVADQTLEDDKILTPLLVNIVFGDPGVGTAVFVAARATRGCLSASELARLFPGR
ncbi:MAG: hypothetical protein ABIQ73_09090 [Acidimicrobiales bacterium]